MIQTDLVMLARKVGINPWADKMLLAGVAEINLGCVETPVRLFLWVSVVAVLLLRWYPELSLLNSEVVWVGDVSSS